MDDTTRLTYREYALCVERFAGALTELGVSPGQVVVFQLPSVWQVPALLLACYRAGAIAVPIMPTIRRRELERILKRLGASVCITVDSWSDFGHAESLAEMASRLPRLRHRVILGSHVGKDEVDFFRHFEDTPWETYHDVSLDNAVINPDGICLALPTSGTTGRPKAALHTHNTLYATLKGCRDTWGNQPDNKFFTPHQLTHMSGINYSVQLPLLVGGCGIVTDAWEPEAVSAFLEEAGVTQIGAAAIFLDALLAPLRRHPDRLRTLKHVQAMGTTIPAQTISAVNDVLGLPLRAIWATTEGGLTLMNDDDPSDYVEYSVGRISPGTELNLRAERGEISPEHPARLFVRGANVCLATMGCATGDLHILAEHDNGWYDTGDLATWDGRGGIRIMGRAADRIGGAFMIPVNYVESALAKHPDVKDVALVGYPDGKGGELACAIAVPRARGLSLGTLRHYLAGLEMTEWYWPSRLELVTELPRNSQGKVRKDLLARQLRGDQEPDAGHMATAI
jgi:cyclohexanecarboxylate-CoA ligase